MNPPALTPEGITAIVCDALPVRGTVDAVRNIDGGVTVRVTGSTLRLLALMALDEAGFYATCNEPLGLLHVPAPRRETT